MQGNSAEPSIAALSNAPISGLVFDWSETELLWGSLVCSVTIGRTKVCRVPLRYQLHCFAKALILDFDVRFPVALLPP
jgi:hypothetical protein